MLEWNEDEAYSDYPTARVNGYAIVLCCDDDNDLAIHVYDEENDEAIENGEIDWIINGFDSFDDMYLNAEYVAYCLCHTR